MKVNVFCFFKTGEIRNDTEHVIEKIVSIWIEVDEETVSAILLPSRRGSIVVFNKWRNYSPSVDVIPVEIPGRGTRMEESCITDFETLIKQTTAALAGAYDGRPFFIYGHSLGAAVAFETACALQRTYNLKPEKLFVAGRHAPMDPDRSKYRCSMGIEALKADLLHLGMMDKDTLEDETFKEFFLPMIYKDYQLHEDYRYKGEK